MTISRLRHLAVAVVATAALAACGGESAPQDQGGAGDAAEQPAPLVLTADGTVTAKCAMPSAERLATFDTAFAGTVTSLDAGAATLEVDEWYHGDQQPDTVTVQAPSKDLQDLLMAVDFEEGRTYLVSATDTRVTLCGFTAEKTPELEALYDEAFAG